MNKYRTYKVRFKEGSVQRILNVEARFPKQAAYCLGRQMGYKCRQQFHGIIHDYMIEVTKQQAKASECFVMEVWLPSKVDKPHKFFKVTG